MSEARTARLAKRKLAEAFETVAEQPGPPTNQVRKLVSIIREELDGPVTEIDKIALKRATHQLSDLCKQDLLLETIVKEGAINAIVPLLSIGGDGGTSLGVSFEDVEKEACFILGLVAVRPEQQSVIAAAGALPGLVRLLHKHRLTTVTRSQPGSGGVARRAADAITNLAHENPEIKNRVRLEGGVPPLVSLLEAWDMKVQRAAAGALRTLAFKNEENKNQIVECGAVPLLIQMLRSEDVGVHYEAVGVIGNLVHSSQDIKQRVIDEGAMQPVINLLSSSCAESQREAALLLGQFATAKVEYKANIAQRGAVPPLIAMLGQSDTSLREMAAFALGRLAQDSANQAGIVQSGGLPALLQLLESKHYNLQHNAAFALYGLADNEDNIADIIKQGALQRLLECSEKLQVQASKDCVNKTINRVETKLATRAKDSEGNEVGPLKVLSHVSYLLRSSDRQVQQRAALSLARLAPVSELRSIFVDQRGLDILLDMLAGDADAMAEGVTINIDPDFQRQAATAVLALAQKVNATAPIESGPQQPAKTVYLGEQFVNNPTLADVTFVVEGSKFHAHRIALLASSDIFRAMFDSGYRERDADSIDIPNISFDVFQQMMRYIYTGQVEVPQAMAPQLLAASDQYLLEGLKRLCEMAIAESLTVDNFMEHFDLSEQYSAPALGKRCVLFALEHYYAVLESAGQEGVSECMQRMAPLLKECLLEDLNKPADPADAAGKTAEGA